MNDLERKTSISRSQWRLIFLILVGRKVGNSPKCPSCASGQYNGSLDRRIIYWQKRFSKRVIALWLGSKLLRTIDAVRLNLGGLGTVGSVLG
jgi:hypothetical protein